ncbi:MAG: hypothetical protein M0R46_11520 [Candidatus Muirbacterium halophilum]|nr:hypothetical protein [Candidatus Muirbacterium halophilum]
MKKKFQIFGSTSSEDYDVMVFVDEIPITEEAKRLCEKYNKKLYMRFVDTGMPIKKLNCNLAVLKDGVVVEVFKGTSDEVNNSCFLTYDFHTQIHPNQILKTVDRDVDIKIMRSARFMLMYLSRSEHRFDVKRGLKSNFVKKIKVLENIDLTKTTDLGEKGVDWVDYLKSMSFQLGQSLALLNGIELYTKEDISSHFPSLETMLNRTGEDLLAIESMKEDFIRECKLHMKSMKTFDEYKK